MINGRNVVKKIKEGSGWLWRILSLGSGSSHTVSSIDVVWRDWNWLWAYQRTILSSSTQQFAAPERKQVLLMASGALLDKCVEWSMEKADETSDSSAASYQIMTELMNMSHKSWPQPLTYFSWSLIMQSVRGIEIIYADVGNTFHLFSRLMEETITPLWLSHGRHTCNSTSSLVHIWVHNSIGVTKWTHEEAQARMFHVTDLHMEHLNQALKGATAGLGLNLWHKAVE